MELWTSDLSIPSGDDQGFLLPFLESKDVRGVRVSRRGEVCVTSCLLSEELKLLPHLLEMKSKTFLGSTRDLAKEKLEDCIPERRSPDCHVRLW